LIAML